MAQTTTFLLSALAALSFISLLTTAAPLLPAPDIIWVTSTSIDSAEAAATDVVAAFFPANAAAAATTTSEPEATVTKWDTTTVTEQPTTITTATTTPTPPQTWSLPEMFTDLSPLGIKKLAYGSKNIAVVTGIPASASATAASASATPAAFSPAGLPRAWTNSSSAYRIFYPAGSINPGNKPQGGSDFYAVPGELPFKTASNVTLEYSIFFPEDFAWVQGGKLPGLYGGHGGCSGGNDARSCFSTRLMWRKGGAGELYLYAPKDKQTTELCNAPPQSVCDASYGLSVGRGSFHFAAGAWTHVSQTVRLNTPGKQDGGFELLVNGQQIMRRDDVFYRDVPPSSSGDDGDGGNDDDPAGDPMRRDVQTNLNVGYDMLPPLLPLVSKVEDILGGAVPGQEAPLFAPAAVASEGPSVKATNMPTSIFNAPTPTITLTATVTTAQSGMMPPASASAASQMKVAAQAASDDVVGFSGLFFSTFFGGHEQSWASPKDQYTWFKDFGMSINE